MSIGERVPFYSEIINENREILIGTPSSYDTSDESYPVLYLLDGEAHFHHVTGLTKFLAQNQQIPEMLVVGIPNTDRNRDLTPPSTDPSERSEYPTHGSADSFLRFLNEELIPFVEDNYRTRTYRILVGHSFGGLFALHSLLDASNPFNAYITLSPSLQWNNQRLTQAFQEYFSVFRELPRDLYLAKGNESSVLLPGFDQISTTLENADLEEFRWKSEVLSEESHNSLPYRAIHRGLEFIFEDWVIDDYMSIFNRDGLSGLRDVYQDTGQRFGYERNLPPTIVMNLFGRLGSEGRVEEAAEVLSFYETIAQPQAFLYEALAEGFLEKNEIERASDYYKAALEIDPGNEYYRSRIADLERDL